MLRAISLIVFVLVVPANVSSQSSEKQPPPQVIDPDNFNFVSLEHEKPVIDSFARDLRLKPERKGHIIAYGGRVSCKGEAKQILALIKGYLVNEHKIDEGRIVTIDGGYRENTTFEMWRAPPGTAAHTPVPTVDAREVKFLRQRHPKCRGLRESPVKPRRA